ncbi:MAG: esterase-like activity of phytase family protein [Hyphomicrobiales bacterium]
MYQSSKFSSLAALLVALSSTTAMADMMFSRISSFPVNENIPSAMDQKTESSAEIISATDDGTLLIYSDSPMGGVGMVDISDPTQPTPAGFLSLNGEPTSVSVVGKYALIGVNTSQSYTAPSGNLSVVNIETKSIETACELGGQPDSIAISPDKSLVAVAIENERDEDFEDGVIPQLPAGNVTVFSLKDGLPVCDSMKVVDLTGLADIAGSDPEPEFVDFNAMNEIVVTLQENNYLAVIDGVTGEVKSHFSAGSVDLENVDVEEEGALTFDGKLDTVPREPDAVQWLDTDRFVTANEGDYKGGSRGFTIFRKSGEVLYDSGLDFEYRVAMAGHYPEGRSSNKGSEPEGLEVGTFNGDTFIFVLSERGSVVGVYRDTGAAPEFVQLLPTGLAPEGVIAVPGRNLLAVANEADLIDDGGVRSHVTLYQLADQPAAYPMIQSVVKDGRPIGWGALSGLTADPSVPGKLYAVNDSFYAMQPTIFTIDATQQPATITAATPVTRNGAPAQLMDLEGITVDGEGGFWLASEGRTDRMIPHGLYHVNAAGEIKQQIAFPSELLHVEKRFGSEGVAMNGTTLWIAIQREWADDSANQVKLVSYDTESKEWGAVLYPTETADKGWTGLSEITIHGDYAYIVERDNQIGANAKLKRLYRVALSEMKPAKLGGKLPIVSKELVRDFLPDLKATGGYVVDKIEGFTIDVDGVGFAVTDNDGTDDSNGETLFFSTGKM